VYTNTGIARSYYNRIHQHKSEISTLINISIISSKSYMAGLPWEAGVFVAEELSPDDCGITL
jgi:hypothetical protein